MSHVNLVSKSDLSVMLSCSLRTCREWVKLTVDLQGALLESHYSAPSV